MDHDFGVRDAGAGGVFDVTGDPAKERLCPANRAENKYRTEQHSCAPQFHDLLLRFARLLIRPAVAVLIYGMRVYSRCGRGGPGVRAARKTAARAGQRGSACLHPYG